MVRASSASYSIFICFSAIVVQLHESERTITTKDWYVSDFKANGWKFTDSLSQQERRNRRDRYIYLGLKDIARHHH